MIRPRLSKVASGTRLTTDLVNGIINRTEYAADLLRQYKLTAGNGMYVEPHYDGTRVSYLQPVAGGATPTQPLNKKYKIVGQTNSASFVYDGSAFTDISYPGAQSTLVEDIDGNNIVGRVTVGNITKGFIYDGSTFTDIIYPGLTNTQAFGVSGGKVCGVALDVNRTQRFFSWIYDGNSFKDLIYPDGTSGGTFAYGISGEKVVGYHNVGSGSIGWIYDGSSFSQFKYGNDNNTVLRGIDGLSVVGDSSSGVWLYDGSNFTLLNMDRAFDIQGSYIVGNRLDNPPSYTGVFFDGTTYTTINYPNATSTQLMGVTIN